jgi:hypothetical protein
MRLPVVVLLLLCLAGCGFRQPLSHEPVIWSTQKAGKAEIVRQLEQAMIREGIPIQRADPAVGTIVSDSFDVLPEYCDCGKNLLGQDFPGERRGVMKVRVTANDSTKVKFDFTTKLKILANQKIVICPSYGVLEQKLIEQVRPELSESGE